MFLIPHHVSCAIFIKNVLKKFQENENLINDPDAVHLKHQLLITILKLIKDANMVWKEFQQTCINIDRSIFSICMKEIHQIVSLEELSETFNTFEELCNTKQNIKIVSRTGVVGLFLRKIVITFKKLTYEEANCFLNMLQSYTDLKKYLDSSRTFSDESCMSLSTIDESILEEKENIPFGTDIIENLSKIGNKLDINENKIEQFIREQVELISAKVNLALNPSDLQAMIKPIKEKHPHIKEVHYLSFLNYLRISEVNSALHSLKSYFDYKDFDIKISNNDVSDLERHFSKFRRFRYSALNLAMMYCVLGHYETAEGLLKEAIKMSQATNDQNCLDQAMFWLKYVSRETKNNVSTGKENTSVKLNLLLTSNETPQFLDIDYLSCLQLIKADGVTANQLPSNLFSALSLIGMSQSILVSNYADLTYFALLHCFGLINCAYTFPYVMLVNQNDTFPLAQLNEETKVLALIDIAVCHQFSSLYEQSLILINFAKSMLPIYSGYHSKLNLFKFCVEFEQSLNVRNVDIAFQKMKSISLIDENEGLYYSLIIEIMNGNSAHVLTRINSIVNKDDSSISVNYKIKLMLLKIEILLKSCQPTQTLDDILKVLTLTQKHYFLGHNISGNLYLLQALLQLNLLKQADRIISKTVINTISFGSTMQQGVLFFLYGKLLKEQSFKLNDSDRKINLLDAISLLDKAFLQFQKGNILHQMKNVQYEKSFVYNELSYIRERNESAMQFRLLNESIGHFPDVLLF